MRGNGPVRPVRDVAMLAFAVPPARSVSAAGLPEAENVSNPMVPVAIARVAAVSALTPKLQLSGAPFVARMCSVVELPAGIAWESKLAERPLGSAYTAKLTVVGP